MTNKRLRILGNSWNGLQLAGKLFEMSEALSLLLENTYIYTMYKTPTGKQRWILRDVMRLFSRAIEAQSKQ